jgi:hypothetical protein
MTTNVTRLPVAPLACQDVASQVATRDREETAALVLAVARAAAIERLLSDVGTREYRRARAALTLHRAVESAARILGGGA